MNAIELNLANWEASLLKTIPLGGLFSRNEIAYKWKGTFLCWILRETVFWRLNDLVTQSYHLHKLGHALGARVLLRSAMESLAILIYLNQQIQKVLMSELSFHEFSSKTSQLLLGSKDGSTDHTSINIMTILDHCDKKYDGIRKMYSSLSESAHPNSEGLLLGYSSVDHNEQETHFANRWSEMYGKSHVALLNSLMEIFHHEYNDVWVKKIRDLEEWLVDNDGMLEATKG